MPHDPKLYREMSEPFKTPDEANAAIKAFFDDLGDIRKKHGLRDVLCVIQGSCIYPDQGEGEFITTAMHGSEDEAEPMAAYALGLHEAERRERINKIRSRKK